MSVAAPFRRPQVEQVPVATQLIALSFASAVSGVLLDRSPQVRVVMHRTMSRAGQRYLQQASPYAGEAQLDHSRTGRIHSFSTGIMGFAAKHRKVARTRIFETEDALFKTLRSDMTRVKDGRPIEEVARSYLAIPMTNAGDEIVSVLYADSKTARLFDDTDLIIQIVGMCQGFCRLVDQATKDPLPRTENFAPDDSAPVFDEDDVYGNFQEVIDDIPIPKYGDSKALNFEAFSN